MNAEWRIAMCPHCGEELSVENERQAGLDRCAHERDAPGWCYTHDAFWPNTEAVCNRVRAAVRNEG